MRLGKRNAAVTGAAVVIGVAALGGVAVATGNTPLGDQDLSQPGSITVDESSLPEDDAAERDALAALATVEEAAAGAAAAESLGGGEVLAAELEDEDGFVVWEVEVRAADGTVQEVTVDAGDATILGTEREDDDREGDYREGDDREGADREGADREGAETEAAELSQPGTVAVDASTLPADDVAEQAALAELATVEQSAAEAAAVKAAGGGEVVRAELEEEDGFVVWDVVVRAADGTLQEVTLDAGNAAVLGLEGEDDEVDGPDSTDD